MQGVRRQRSDVEPFAFLGAWLHAGRDFADADQHKLHAPLKGGVREYANSQGWLSPS